MMILPFFITEIHEIIDETGSETEEKKSSSVIGWSVRKNSGGVVFFSQTQRPNMFVS